MIRAVVFDMDGVLFDTENLGMVTQLRACLEVGYTVEESLLMKTLGVSMAAGREILKSALGVDFPYEHMVEKWTELMYAHMAVHGIPVKPGVFELLKELEECGMKTAVATSNNRDIVESYMKMAGLTDAFDVMVCGDAIQRSKPAPDIYLAAADLLGVSPEECMGIEDSLNGVRSVRAANMTCVMVPDMIPFTAELSYYVDHCVKTLLDVIPLLKKGAI